MSNWHSGQWAAFLLICALASFQWFAAGYFFGRDSK